MAKAAMAEQARRPYVKHRQMTGAEAVSMIAGTFGEAKMHTTTHIPGRGAPTTEIFVGDIKGLRTPDGVVASEVGLQIVNGAVTSDTGKRVNLSEATLPLPGAEQTVFVTHVNRYPKKLDSSDSTIVRWSEGSVQGEVTEHVLIVPSF